MRPDGLDPNAAEVEMGELPDGMPGQVSWFRYVQRRRVAAYRFVGWIEVGAVPSHHDRWSVLMRYGGPPCERPPEPARGTRPRLRSAGTVTVAVPRRRGWVRGAPI